MDELPQKSEPLKCEGFDGEFTEYTVFMEMACAPSLRGALRSGSGSKF